MGKRKVKYFMCWDRPLQPVEQVGNAEIASFSMRINILKSYTRSPIIGQRHRKSLKSRTNHQRPSWKSLIPGGLAISKTGG
jgi:hypothetical protein